MKIGSLNYINSTVFGSTILYKAKIKQHLHECENETPCDVFITRLDKTDLYRLKRDEKDWEDTRFGKILIEALENTNPQENEENNIKTFFYAVETPSKIGENQIRAMAMATNYLKENRLELDWLQTNNDLCMPNVIKGAGSCLLFAILKLAKKCNADSFSVYSVNNALGFYKLLGLKRKEAEYNEFTLEKRLFARKADNIRKKYNIEHAGTINNDNSSNN